MLKQAIIFTLIVLGAVFVAVPRPAGEGDAEAAAVPPAEQTAASGDERERATSHPAETVLTRAPDGHYYAEVSVGGRRARMLVDTGASIVALTGADARALGLRWHPADLQVIGHGASGAVRGVPALLPEVEVAGHRVRGVRAAIIPEGLGVSLLGQSFLGQVGRVEIADGRMVLGSG